MVAKTAGLKCEEMKMTANLALEYVLFYPKHWDNVNTT
jgi:hypothetical protein